MKLIYYKYAYKSNYDKVLWKEIYLPLNFNQAKKFMILWHESFSLKLEELIHLNDFKSAGELKTLLYYENNPNLAIEEWPGMLGKARIISYKKICHYLNFIENFNKG